MPDIVTPNWFERVLARAPNSFQFRLLFITGVALSAFFLLTTLVLERAFAATLRQERETRLESTIYTVLTAAEEPHPGQLIIPAFLRDERLNQIDSGVYAYVADGHGEILWRSASSLKRELPTLTHGALGQVSFSEERSSEQSNSKERWISARYDAIWEGVAGSETRYSFIVHESTTSFDASIARFRHTAWVWLGLAAIVLVAVFAALLHWGTRPLRQVTKALNDVEAGRAERIVGEFPQELRQLTDNLNFFIETEREQRQRYADTMANLAHSLKTPLAVLHTVTEREKDADLMRTQVREQATRMNDIVRYQLQRAVTKGRTPFATTNNVAPLLRETISAMEKVYGRRGIQFELSCPEQVPFAGETGDFMEILGNLLDNAGKWAKTRVRCYVNEMPISRGRQLVRIEVEDDGPGIPKDVRPEVLDRGARLDTRVEGQGIGLAVVTELVAAYHGKLEFGTSPELGGAWISIELPV